MKKGVLGKGAIRILMKDGVGYRKKDNLRIRKRVRGENIGEDTVQVNMKVTTYGKKDMAELLGLNEETEKKEE